jgi:hypothetical protein
MPSTSLALPGGRSSSRLAPSTGVTISVQLRGPSIPSSSMGHLRLRDTVRNRIRSRDRKLSPGPTMSDLQRGCGGITMPSTSLALPGGRSSSRLAPVPQFPPRQWDTCACATPYATGSGLETANYHRQGLMVLRNASSVVASGCGPQKTPRLHYNNCSVQARVLDL